VTKTWKRLPAWPHSLAKNRLNLALICVVGLLASCRYPETGARLSPAVTTVTARVQDSLVHELRRLTSPEYALPASSSIRIVVDTSDVVPGLEYWWGDYSPPGTADVLYRAVVASREDVAVVLRTPADWATVATSWRPFSADGAVGACREIVHVTMERHFPRVRPRVYQDAGSLPAKRGRDSVQQQLRTPIITRREQSWVVDFWVIGARDVTELRCELGPTSAYLTTIRVFRGYVTTPVF